MIYHVSDPQAAQQPQAVKELQGKPAAQADLRPSWWVHPSPWLWGLVALLVIAGIAITQVPRLSTGSSAAARSPNMPNPTALPALSGSTYTQIMASGRDFNGRNLRGARLEHLDLRGKSFQGADAAGSVFAGSFLNGAIFADANLRGADFRDTCLRGADLAGAQLAGADFTGADVTGATVTQGAIHQTIGWASTAASPVCPTGPLPRSPPSYWEVTTQLIAERRLPVHSEAQHRDQQHLHPAGASAMPLGPRTSAQDPFFLRS